MPLNTAKMVLLGDTHAIKQGAVPVWVVNVMVNLNKSVFKEIIDSESKIWMTRLERFFCWIGKVR